MAKKFNNDKLIFYPRKDKVVLAATRRENKIILLNDNKNDENGVTYESLEVVSWGPLVEGFKVGDKIKLSDSIVAQPQLLYCNYNENEPSIDENKKKIDYLLVSDAFIQGIWGNID
jgi:hypothetical protein